MASTIPAARMIAPVPPADGPPHPHPWPPSHPLLIALVMSQDFHLNWSKITLTNLTPTGMARVVSHIRSPDIDSCSLAKRHNPVMGASEDGGESESSRHQWEWKVGQPLWKTGWQLLKRVSPWDPTKDSPQRSHTRASERRSHTHVHCSRAHQSGGGSRPSVHSPTNQPVILQPEEGRKHRHALPRHKPGGHDARWNKAVTETQTSLISLT